VIYATTRVNSFTIFLQEAVKCLSSLHDKYVIVPADKASNNIVFVCKSYYFECLIKELGINSNTSSNTTYKPTSLDKDEIHLSETLMLNDIQISSDYMSRWVVLKRRVGAVTSQRVLKVLLYVNILQCFFVVET
jgi:hypothetical protein